MGFIPRNVSVSVLLQLHQIRDHLTLVMGALVGTPAAVQIARIETEIANFRDEIFGNYSVCVSRRITRKLNGAINSLDRSLIKLAQGRVRPAGRQIDNAVRKLAATTRTISRLANRGKIPLSAAQEYRAQLAQWTVELSAIRAGL